MSGVKFELSKDLFTHGRIFMEGLHASLENLRCMGNFMNIIWVKKKFESQQKKDQDQEQEIDEGTNTISSLCLI